MGDTFYFHRGKFSKCILKIIQNIENTNRSKKTKIHYIRTLHLKQHTQISPTPTQTPIHTHTHTYTHTKHTLYLNVLFKGEEKIIAILSYCSHLAHIYIQITS